MAAGAEELALLGSAAVTPLGHDVQTTAAALRARLCALAEQRLYAVETRDPAWDAEQLLKAAFVDELPAAVVGRERLLELALWVLRDLVISTGLGRGELARAALLLALPPLDDVTTGWRFDTFATDLAERAGIAPCAVTGLNHAGHAGVFQLLGEAARRCAEGQVERCVLVAVDSYASPARLRLLDEAMRLRTDRSPDGFLPGEAAVGLVVAPADATASRPAALLGPAGLGDEPQHLATERASSGQGLSRAIAAALDGPTATAPVAWSLADLNGERYRAFEWGTVRGRLAHRFAPALQLQHPAESVGDVGAASGALLVAWAAQAFARGYAPAANALLWTSSDGGARAAVHLRAPDQDS